jgi:hypothetical protein
MPTKLKPSVKHWDRKTGKTNSDRANPKLRIKCKRELDRRANVKRR